jgi:hypothetical protein
MSVEAAWRKKGLVYIVHYRDDDNRHRSITFDDKTEAQAFDKDWKARRHEQRRARRVGNALTGERSRRLSEQAPFDRTNSSLGRKRPLD